MLKVNVIGIGPGNPDLLTGEARQAIAESTVLAGDKRMVGQFGPDDQTGGTGGIGCQCGCGEGCVRHSGFR